MRKRTSKKRNRKTFNILALDGGGAKGVYTISALRGVEDQLGSKLSNHFDLIFGTSTGAIIGALIALEYRMSEIEKIYDDFIPNVLGKPLPSWRSRALRQVCNQLFDNKTFNDFKVDIGIVATNQLHKRPMIFKTNPAQAHKGGASFEPGFGASLTDAIVASCAAQPFFKPVSVKTSRWGTPDLIDGGFVANNPALFPIVDAVSALKIKETDLRVLSVGTGIFPEAKRWGLKWFYTLWPGSRLSLFLLDSSSNTIDLLRELIFKRVQTVRLNRGYNDQKYATDLLETNSQVLSLLKGAGTDTYHTFERDITKLLK